MLGKFPNAESSLPAISFCCPTFCYCFDKYSQFFKACICSDSHSNNAYAKSIFICEKGKQKQKLLTFDLYGYLVDKHLCVGSSWFSMSVILISFCFLLKTLLFYHFNYTQKILPSLFYHLHPYEELRTTIKIFLSSSGEWKHCIKHCVKQCVNGATQNNSLREIKNCISLKCFFNSLLKNSWNPESQGD